MNELKSLINSNKATLLGLGPMSLNSIKSIIEIANSTNIPTQMIASRRQIDSKENGGGYVAGFTTEEFVPFVRNLDKKNKIIITRDHGGPWQNNFEVERKLALNEAMRSAKVSFANDILSGMDAIHIDPSFDPQGLTKEQLSDRIVELYEFCLDTSAQMGKSLLYEIGAEQQRPGFENFREFNDSIITIIKRIQSKNLPLPHFVVLQTGTKVMDKSNYGELASIEDQNRSAHQGILSLKECIRVCNEVGIMVKSHNGDYLEGPTLKLFPELGVHGLNIAPELGVMETEFILKSLKNKNLKKEYDELVGKILMKNKWQKWIDPEHPVSDMTKVEISGHYCFEEDFFKEIKSRLEVVFAKQNRDLNLEIMNLLKDRMMTIYKSLNWKISHG